MSSRKIQYIEEITASLASKDLTLIRTLGQGAFGRVLELQQRDGSRVAAKIAVTDGRRINIRDLRAEVKLHRGVCWTLGQHLAGSSSLWGKQTSRCRTGLSSAERKDCLSKRSRSSTWRNASPVEVLNVEECAVAGLAFLHVRRLVHRDVKPGNILCFGDATCKLSDFGLSNKVDIAATAATHCGTPGYMAPGLTAGREYDAGVDSFSLGVVLYEFCEDARPAPVANNSSDRPRISSHWTADLSYNIQELLRPVPMERMAPQDLRQTPAVFSKHVDH
ncbi:hypothetical protein V8E36_006068 [Tilletia maclaganii]